jgi:maleylacetoacetate isomerase
VRIALNLKGVAYESVLRDLARGAQRSPEYLGLNPQGLVPALEDEGDIIPQSLAIIEYLDETCPQPLLLPGHPSDRARVRALAQIVVSDIHPLNNLRVKSYLAQAGQDEATWKIWYAHWIAEGFAALEAMLAGDDRTGTYCHGDEPSLADICLIPQVANGRRVDLDMTPYPTIRRIYDACMALPAFVRAHPDNQPAAA